MKSELYNMVDVVEQYESEKEEVARMELKFWLKLSGSPL